MERVCHLTTKIEVTVNKISGIDGVDISESYRIPYTVYVYAMVYRRGLTVQVNLTKN